jgi:hypothetical protein
MLLSRVSFMLSVNYAECRKQAQYAEFRYAKCRYAECRYAECHGTLFDQAKSYKTLFVVI